MSLLRLVYNIIRTAGAESEGATRRDGFLSWAGETHAVGYGLALGTTAGLAVLGVPQPMMIVLAALGGVGGLRKRRNERVWKEIRNEFQYFAGSIGVGLALVLFPAVMLDVPISSPV